MWCRKNKDANVGRNYSEEGKITRHFVATSWDFHAIRCQSETKYIKHQSFKKR